MARPRADDYDAKRGLILDRAAERFAAVGFARTSMAELAAACGASKAWLYHYYPSKEAILFDMLHAHMTRLTAAADRTLAGDGPPRSRFRALLHALLAEYANARHKHVALLNDLDNLAMEQQALIKTLERQLVDQVAALLSELNPAAMTAANMRKPAAMLLFGAINWTYTWYRPDGAVTPAQFADLAATVFLDGFASLERG